MDYDNKPNIILLKGKKKKQKVIKFSEAKF